MCEEVRAIENLPEMLEQVPGIGVVIIGEGDLSQDLGYPRQYEHPTVAAAIDEILAICKQYNVACGHPHVDSQNVERLLEQGLPLADAGALLLLRRAGARPQGRGPLIRPADRRVMAVLAGIVPAHPVVGKVLRRCPPRARSGPVRPDGRPRHISPLGCKVGNGSTAICMMPGTSTDRLLP